MAEAIYIKESGMRNYTPGADVAAGAVIVLTTHLVAIARDPILDSVLGTIYTTGIYDVLQVAVAFTDGQAVYWDADGTPVSPAAATGAATTNSALGPFMGWAIGATLNTELTVRVDLRSVEDSAAEQLTLAQLSDVGATVYGAGKLLIADADSYEEQTMSGDATIGATGVVTVGSFAAMPTIPSATVAALGTDQTNAAAITTGFTLVTAADGTVGVILPTAVAGSVAIIKNAAAQILKIYPFAADQINDLTHTTGSLDVAASVSLMLVAFDATDWYSVPLLPS